jgi:hypothetical protein
MPGSGFKVAYRVAFMHPGQNSRLPPSVGDNQHRSTLRDFLNLRQLALAGYPDTFTAWKRLARPLEMMVAADG